MKKIFLITLLAVSLNINAKDNPSYFIVKVKIEGQIFKLAFDTGAQKTILFNKSIFNENNSSKFGIISANRDTIDGLMSKKRMKIDLFELDIVEKIQLCYIPNDNSTMKNMFDIDGIMGNDIISYYDWHFDFRTNLLSVVNTKKKKEIVLNDFIDAALTKENDCDYLDFTTYIPITGKKNKFKMFVDFGDNGHISLNDTLQLQHKNQFISVSKTTDAAGDSNRAAPLNSGTFEVANYKFSNIIYTSHPKALKRSNAVGLAFFAMFGEVYLLNSEKKMLLKKITTQTIKLRTLRIIDNVIYTMLIPIEKFTKKEDFIENNLLVNKLNLVEETIQLKVEITKIK